MHKIKKRKIEKICECCQLRKLDFPTQKECSWCSSYVKDIKSRLRAAKYMLKLLRIKVYGQKSGSERLRF